VSVNRKRWKAKIGRRHCGTYDTKEEAAVAYDIASREMGKRHDGKRGLLIDCVTAQVSEGAVHSATNVHIVPLLYI
jgi:hypothetical protein